MKHERLTPVVALAHPLWWAALALLVVNDHVLKGSGWIAGSITGKLSDFAGLVVAPAVLSILVRARSRRHVLACAGAVFVVFTLIKLSAAAAGALVGVLRPLIAGAQICVDPTDLFALPMLWLGVRVQEPPRNDSPVRSALLGRSMLRRGALALGLLACMATTQQHKFASASLVNHRAFPLSFQIGQASVDCATFDARDAARLTTEDFGTRRRHTLEAQEHLDIEGACGAAWVTIPKVYDAVIAWDHLSARYPADGIEQWLLDRGLVAEGSRSRIRVAIGKELRELARPRDGSPTLPVSDAGAP